MQSPSEASHANLIVPAAGILLMGTSHVGKSTIASRIARRADVSVYSTDKMGRHPGRPWTGVPTAVLEHFLNLSDDAIHWFLNVHHQNLAPVIARLLQDTSSGVFEGAALRPEFLEGWRFPLDCAICLHASEELLRERICSSLAQAQASEAVHKATEKFITRSLRENDALFGAAQRLGVKCLDVGAFLDPGSLELAVCARINEIGRPH